MFPQLVIAPLQQEAWKLIVPDVPPVELEHVWAFLAMLLQAGLKFEQLPEQDALHMPPLPNVQSGWQV